MRKLFVLAVFVGLFVCCGVDTYALTITETDTFGNEEIVLHVPDESLEASATTWNMRNVALPPSPGILAQQIPGLASTARELPFPSCASFVLLDFGPNWNTLDYEDGIKPGGRYGYFFFGIYEKEVGKVCSGGSATALVGNNKYTWTGLSDTPVEARECKLQGPLAFASYNDTTGEIFMHYNTYADGFIGKTYTFTITGVTVPEDTANASYYPKITCFADDSMSYFQAGSYYLYDDWTDKTWNMSYTGEFNTGGEVQSDFWQYITNGMFSDSDNPIVQIFTKAIQGIAQVVTFIQDVPTYFTEMVSFLPPAFAQFLGICVGMIVAAMILKLALNVLG